MKKHELKALIFSKCYENQQKIADNANIAMKEAQESANDYGQPRDRYDSFRAQILRKRDLYAEQYERALENLKLLDKIDPQISNENVSFGACIVTNAQKMFVSIGMGKLDINGDTWYAISPAVPIFKALDGKKEGDEFTFNGRKFKIKELF